MKNIKIKGFFRRQVVEKVVIIIASIALIYLLISLYFINHFFFRTVINGADVSLKAYDDIEEIFERYTHDYELMLFERNDETEKIKGADIGLRYNKKNSVSKIYSMQSSLGWFPSLFKEQKYNVNDLFVYNTEELKSKINELECLNKKITEPKNVGFKYSNGSYLMVKERYGNKTDKVKLVKTIKTGILTGVTKIDLDEKQCYINPKYTINSQKAMETRKLLDKYVKAKITYLFGSENEVLTGNIINKWLTVDEELEVVIDEAEAMKYVQALGKKYDTIGVTRDFKTSTGKIVEVKGGIYGWKINKAKETEALLGHIKQGESIEKEPQYSQKAFSREKNDIGNTYVEINITRQHVWFYKDGKMIIQGPVVTGNPSKGNSTKLGTFMLNYKIKGATLRGPGYEAKVTYWMPFYGNIGLHDASWRYSFGGDIYKRRGSHGCVNAPKHLAKIIFEYIEEGTPIICYEE
nr:peptidoglycan binding domain-containing protein [uncultured Anaerocolumna sp.]